MPSGCGLRVPLSILGAWTQPASVIKPIGIILGIPMDSMYVLELSFRICLQSWGLPWLNPLGILLVALGVSHWKTSFGQSKGNSSGYT